MKINELRLGNYVMYDGYECIVESIHSPRPLRDEKLSNKFLLGLISVGGLVTATLDECSPIKLTDKELKSFGFEHAGWQNYFKGNEPVGIKVIKDGVEIQYLSERLDRKVNTVHQLQNVYYNLLGLELTGV